MMHEIKRNLQEIEAFHFRPRRKATTVQVSIGSVIGPSQTPSFAGASVPVAQMWRAIGSLKG